MHVIEHAHVNPLQTSLLLVRARYGGFAFVDCGVSGASNERAIVPLKDCEAMEVY